MIYLYYDHQSKSTWLILTLLYPIHCYWFYGYIKQRVHIRNKQMKCSQFNNILYNHQELEKVLNDLMKSEIQMRFYIFEEDDYNHEII